MAKIKQFDKTTLKVLRVEVNAVLEKLGKKLGIALQINNISYTRDGLQCHTKLQAIIQSTDETKSSMTAEQLIDFNNLKSYGSMFGVSEKDFGRTFTSLGETFKLTGIAPKRHKYPVIAENVLTGKEFVFASDVIDRLKKK